MTENRNSDRELILRTGRITCTSGPDPIDCAILNISPTGACVLLPLGSSVPEVFHLTIDREDGSRCCKRIWQRGSRMGLKFIVERDEPSRSVA